MESESSAILFAGHLPVRTLTSGKSAEECRITRKTGRMEPELAAILFAGHLPVRTLTSGKGTEECRIS